MLDLVPLARSWRIVTDRNRQPRASRELLEFPLPEPHPRAVAATGIGGDQQRPRPRIRLSAHDRPPARDRAHPEPGGIVIDADADPALVATEIVYAVGNGLALLRHEKVVDAHWLGGPSGAPGAARILEVAHELLLLRVDRNDWLGPSVQGPREGCQIPKLGVPVGMLSPLAFLPIGLQPVARSQEQGPDRRMAHRMPTGRQ